MVKPFSHTNYNIMVYVIQLSGFLFIALPSLVRCDRNTKESKPRVPSMVVIATYNATANYHRSASANQGRVMRVQ